MTLNRHQIDGLPPFIQPTTSSENFDRLMTDAGYTIAGSAPAQGGRVKIWWTHEQFSRVESIYSPDKVVVITAYHV
jgi:hypothetical protein